LIDAQRTLIAPRSDLICAKVSRIIARWMRTPSCVPLIDARRTVITAGRCVIDPKPSVR
jgi:hypothetical protein